MLSDYNLPSLTLAARTSIHPWGSATASLMPWPTLATRWPRPQNRFSSNSELLRSTCARLSPSCRWPRAVCFHTPRIGVLHSRCRLCLSHREHGQRSCPQCQCPEWHLVERHRLQQPLLQPSRRWRRSNQQSPGRDCRDCSSCCSHFS